MEKRTESLSDNPVQAGKALRLLFHNVPEFYYYTKYGQLRAKTLGAEEDKNPLTSLKYFYSRPGMIVAREVNGARQNYKYDRKGQLLGVYDDKGNAIEEYVYDPAGNILKKTVQGKTTTYKYDKANQLVSSECNGKVIKYEYDAAGRLVKEGDKVYSYIGLDKIESVTENGQKLSSFSYHIGGQLAEAVTPEKRETFQWDGLALIQRNSTNYINEPAVTGGNPILADDKVLFNDMLGTTLGIKDGDKVMQNNLTAFGESLNSSLLTENSFFTGKPHIGELGYAFLFRNYRPDQGKWQTSDPLGYPDGWNNFAYCNNHAGTAIDYLGAYEIEWKGTWTDAEKTAVLNAFSAVNARIYSLISQITNQIEHLISIRENSNVITEKADALISTISTFRYNLATTRSNILSTTYNLEIYQADLPTGVDARYWASTVPWYDDELTIDYEWFVNASDMGTIFHELTHTWSDDGESGNDFINAHIIERLYSNNFSSWIVYKSEYRKIFE